MLVMILIHTNAYHLSNKIAYLLWDYSQFAVPVFIFCSTYIFFQRPFAFDFKNLWNYLKKRLNRLLIPYYLFSVIFIFLVFLGEPQRITQKFLLGNFIFLDGMAINWLIVLFLFFTLIMPLLYYLEEKLKIVFYVFLFLSLSSSLFFMSGSLPFPYQLTMWLPWSLIIVFGIYFVRYKNTKWFLPATIIIALLVFLLTRQFQIMTNHSLVMYNNKYPPNLYHLSYGVFSIPLFYLIFKTHFLNFFPVRNLFIFLSKNSYTIYFIHYLVIYALTVLIKTLKFDWISFFIVVLVSTLIVQWSFNKTKNHFFSTLNKGPTI